MLSLDNLFLLTALINFILGLAALLAPRRILESSDPSSILTFQKLGAAALVVGLLAWWARGLVDPTARQTIALFLALFYALNAALTFLGIFKGGSPKSEWTFALLDSALALAFFYFRFLAWNFPPHK